MFGCVRQYVPDAKPGDTVMLTRAQFGVFAKEWYGIEGIA